MKDYESQIEDVFARIGNEPRPRKGHEKALRERMLAEFEPAGIRVKRGPGVRNRLFMVLTNPATAGLAACIAALFVGHYLLTNFTWQKGAENGPAAASRGSELHVFDVVAVRKGEKGAKRASGGAKMAPNDAESAPNGTKAARESAKMAQNTPRESLRNLLEQEDVGGLEDVLEKGDFEQKIAAAKLLSDLGARSAVGTLNRLAGEWDRPDPNPFANAAKIITSAANDPNSQP